MLRLSGDVLSGDALSGDDSMYVCVCVCLRLGLGSKYVCVVAPRLGVWRDNLNLPD